MSVYDTFGNIEMVATIALIVFVVGLIIAAIIDAVKGDSIVPYNTVKILSICALISAFIMVVNLFYVREKQYSNTEYDVAQMAIDYDARVVESDDAACPYISHFEGYGSEEWIYFVRKPDAQDIYRRESEC